MKKLSLMFLLLVAGLYFTACGDDSDVPANGYIETTEEGSTCLRGKGLRNLSISWRRSLREVHGAL